jgi:hypothetical protein
MSLQVNSTPSLALMMLRWKPVLALWLLHGVLSRPAHSQDAPVRRELTAILQAHLAILDSAQRQYRASHGTYAASTWRLRQESNFSDVPGITTLILDAGAERWSAVAVQRALPGFRCIRSVDQAIGATASTCSGEFDLLDLASKAPTDFEGGLARQNLMRAECHTRAETADTGRVVFEGTVDTNGRLELKDLAVSESPKFTLSYAGLFAISNCSFQPANIDGRKVPSRRLIPLNIRGRSGD